MSHNAKQGTETSYTRFKPDGTMVAVGDASCFRDEYPANLLPASGATAPDSVGHTIGGVARQLYGFDGTATQEILSGSFEVPHDYKVGSELEIHVHYRPSTTGSGDVKWFFDWEYSPVFGAPSAQTTLSIVDTIAANTQYYHKLKAIGVLPVLPYALGDKIGFNLRRTPSDPQDTYGADVLLEQIAMHVEMDMLGSSEKYVK